MPSWFPTLVPALSTRAPRSLLFKGVRRHVRRPRLNIELGDEIVMPITIFHNENGRTETWLEVNDDGTVTYCEENSGQRMLRRGIEPGNRVMTAEEAKLDWTCYARDIDEAAAAIASKRRLSNSPEN